MTTDRQCIVAKSHHIYRAQSTNTDRLFFTACKAEINHIPYSLGRHMKVVQLRMTEKAKIKNNNNDIFNFFLEYQQAYKQPEEQKREITYI